MRAWIANFLVLEDNKPVHEIFILKAYALSMDESSNFPKSWIFKIQILKLAACQQILNNFMLNGQLS